MFHPFEIAFVGYSNAGKTTLITKVIQELAKEHTVGYIKHDAHTFTMDHKGKDTHRAWKSGAYEVFITDKDHSARLARGKLHTIRQKTEMIDCDCVIVEGRKNSSIKKIVVVDEQKAILPLVTDGTIDNICAFVGPFEKMESQPYFHRDDIEGIVAFIRKHFHKKIDAVPLYGLVLSGGYSTRMQSDKSLLNYHGKPQTEYCYHLLKDHCEHVFVSTRQGQWDDNTFAHLPKLYDRFLEMGPLSGILTAMTTHPEAAWVVLACDLPNVTAETLSTLITGRNPLKMATAYHTIPEPLCAIYEPKSVIRLLEALAIGWYCPRKVLANIPIKTLTLNDSQALANINTKEEYQQVTGK